MLVPRITEPLGWTTKLYRRQYACSYMIRILSSASILAALLFPEVLKLSHSMVTTDTQASPGSRPTRLSLIVISASCISFHEVSKFFDM